tara:strand:- start:1504 stop:2613 length:1110 start_codon:yes stop_codon:yes gene_type:complete
MKSLMNLSDAEPSPVEVLQNLPTAIIVFDESLNIKMANAAAELLFGLSSGFLIHKTITTLIDEDGELVSLLQRAFSERHSVREFGLMLAGPRVKKQKVDVRVSGPTENSQFAIASIQECSLASELDGQNLLGRAARSVSGLTAIFSREVKNPLSGIRGAAQLLGESVSDSDKELTELIWDATDRIKDLVDRMELFSDDRPLTRSAVNIHDVLGHVKEKLTPNFEKTVLIEENYDPSLPLVFGNREQLIQVFDNMVKNSYEALDKDKGLIKIVTSYRHGSLASVLGGREKFELPIAVSITDNGIGIPEDIEKSIFEPFVTTKPNRTGLGLALVAKIIDDHGGIVELDATFQKTTITVFLPVHSAKNIGSN